nr:glycosyltransferase [uncultured Rhodopila sp.]
MPNTDQLRLTVLLVTYNHEAYIRQAVENMLAQKLHEQYEVVVADDHSTDNTRKIIEEIFAATPAAPPVRYLDHTVNRGITENYRRSFSACRTDYVAVLEGDDFWIHPGKLAAQMAFLDEHLECAAVSANYFVYDEKSCRYTARTVINSEFSYVDSRSLINDNLIGNFSTCMYRLAALRAIPDRLYLWTTYDWGVNICIARNALIGFIHTPFSVYRVHENGSWHSLSHDERIAVQLKGIEHYNSSTDLVFDAEFKELARRLRSSMSQSAGGKPGHRRIRAILVACVPPGLLGCAGTIRRGLSRFLLPPIIPIALQKLRKGLS